MSIKKLDNGQYQVDVRPAGMKGKRFRKKFDRKTEAANYEKFIITNCHDKNWCDKPSDKRSLSELIELWYRLYGQTLKRGLEERRGLLFLDKKMGYPKSYQVTKQYLIQFRSKRMESGTQASTLNREHNRLSSVFTALINAGEYHHEHPLKGISKLREKPSEMSFLSQEEIQRLLDNLQGDALIIARLCLSTGSRWSEANELKGEQVINGRVIFLDTKNNKNRAVPIGEKLNSQLKNRSGRLFKNCYSDFYKILKSLDFNLPKGQASHVLRHTFASHFMMNGGNILTLQKILGHGDIKQTLLYAHFSPDYLNDAIKYNPLKE